jgi:WXG100 family type VII secretion target
MSQVRVSTEAVAAAAGQTSAKAAEFEARVEAVRALVASTVGSSWSGAAADAFHADFEEWLTGASDVHSALVAMGQLLSESSVVYQSTEQDVSGVSQDSEVTTSKNNYGVS